MFGWVILLGVCALIAGILGFVALVGVLAFIARIVFLMALALLVISLVSGWMQKRGARETALWRSAEQE